MDGSIVRPGPVVHAGPVDFMPPQPVGYHLGGSVPHGGMASANTGLGNVLNTDIGAIIS